ncbi:hypothetical protein V6N12_040474 [Hibiscus sabdariffa]|uniref:Uncharacterized protein n=1 Tax=Hibiscus sabdariffa TaxID=183260 RepID=A0ABR2E3T3_9ROSI
MEEGREVDLGFGLRIWGVCFCAPNQPTTYIYPNKRQLGCLGTVQPMAAPIQESSSFTQRPQASSVITSA